MTSYETFERAIPYLQWGSWWIALIAFLSAVALLWGRTRFRLTTSSSLGAMPSEKRLYPRSTSNNPFEILGNYGRPNSEWGELVNVSATGACLAYSGALTKGRNFIIRMSIPPIPVERLARVVWSQNKNNRTLYGVRFAVSQTS